MVISRTQALPTSHHASGRREALALITPHLPEIAYNPTAVQVVQSDTFKCQYPGPLAGLVVKSKRSFHQKMVRPLPRTHVGSVVITGYVIGHQNLIDTQHMTRIGSSPHKTAGGRVNTTIHVSQSVRREQADE